MSSSGGAGLSPSAAHVRPAQNRCKGGGSRGNHGFPRAERTDSHGGIFTSSSEQGRPGAPIALERPRRHAERRRRQRHPHRRPGQRHARRRRRQRPRRRLVRQWHAHRRHRADTLNSGAGADTINVRDGKRDTVRCGPGKDKVRADKRDRLHGCERVRSTSTPPPPPDPSTRERREKRGSLFRPSPAPAQ